MAAGSGAPGRTDWDSRNTFVRLRSLIHLESTERAATSSPTIARKMSPQSPMTA